MIQYLLTGLAGLICGVVLVRLLQNKPADAQASATFDGIPAATDAAAAPASTRTLLIAAGALIAVGGVAFLLKGEAPETVGTSAPPVVGAPAASLDDVDTMIAKLEARLAKSPDDGEGFRMLGWSYANTGKPERAIAPYKRALALLPKRADVLTGYGEALVSVAEGVVTPEAKAQFDAALAINPAEPRALYFKALYKAQTGQEKAALDDLITLANQGLASAPWQTDVRQEIKRLSAKLRVDVGSRLSSERADTGAEASDRVDAPDPSAAAAVSALPAANQTAAINGMVEGLAAKLKANPGNPEGWAKLLRSRMVLGNMQQAQADLATARAALKADADGLRLVNETARDLGIPGA